MKSERLWDDIANTEGGGDSGAGVGEDGEGEGVLLDGEVVLARRLRRDAYDEGTTGADFGEDRLPGLQLGHAVGAPAATEEGDDERADREQVGGADEAAIDRVG